MNITPDMVVAVPEDEDAEEKCTGCIFLGEDNECLHQNIPAINCNNRMIIYQLKPEYLNTAIGPIEVLNVTRSQFENIVQEQQARIAELEAELAKYKN